MACTEERDGQVVKRATPNYRRVIVPRTTLGIRAYIEIIGHGNGDSTFAER